MKTVIVYEYYGRFINMWLKRRQEYPDMNMKDALRYFWHHSLTLGDHRIDHKEEYKVIYAEEIR